MPRYLISLTSTGNPELVKRTTVQADDLRHAASFALSALNWARTAGDPGRLLDTWVVAGSDNPRDLPRILATGKVETP